MAIKHLENLQNLNKICYRFYSTVSVLISFDNCTMAMKGSVSVGEGMHTYAQKRKNLETSCLQLALQWFRAECVEEENKACGARC